MQRYEIQYRCVSCDATFDALDRYYYTHAWECGRKRIQQLESQCLSERVQRKQLMAEHSVAIKNLNRTHEESVAYIRQNYEQSLKSIQTRQVLAEESPAVSFKDEIKEFKKTYVQTTATQKAHYENELKQMRKNHEIETSRLKEHIETLTASLKQARDSVYTAKTALSECRRRSDQEIQKLRDTHENEVLKYRAASNQNAKHVDVLENELQALRETNSERNKCIVDLENEVKVLRSKNQTDHAIYKKHITELGANTKTEIDRMETENKQLKQRVYALKQDLNRYTNQSNTYETRMNEATQDLEIANQRNVEWEMKYNKLLKQTTQQPTNRNRNKRH